MAIMTSIALVALGLVLMKRKEIEASLGVREKGDRDLDNIMAKISTMLLAPADCNANFAGLPKTGNPTILYKCNTGTNCRPGAKTALLQVNAANWQLETSLFSKVRIKTMSYTTTNQVQTPPSPGILTLTVEFEKNMGKKGSGLRIVTIPKTFNAFVVTGTYNYVTGVLTDSGNIIACATAPSTTLPY